MNQPELPIIVCPSCHYGFRDSGGPGHKFVCPRAECQHHWEAIGETIRAVQGTEKRQGVAELVVVAGGTPLRAVLASGETIIGRDEGCGVRLDNLMVSRRHARIVIDGTDGTIDDLASSCGTAVNNAFLGQPQRLFPGDTIIIGGATLKFEVRYSATDATKPIADVKQVISRGASTAVWHRGKESIVIPLEDARLTLGRGADRDVIISGPLVSARHAVLEQNGEGWFISDAQSATGTYVNGKPIIRCKLVSGDRIQIGPCLFRFEGNRLVRTLQATAIAVEAFEITKTAGDVTLLDQLTFALQPGEFVGLIGPSGAGKTTLLDALNGLRPATAGDVYLNEDPLYEEYSRLRHHIGYVPQDDIIHRELTVAQALTYAAKLRLPADTNSAEFNRVVAETLEALDLSHRRDVKVGLLSGGQRKRVSVGVELLSRPGVLFLDEPTSGLDPGTESKLMNMFRRLADQGRTVVCTTHVMENIDLFHKIVVLAPGGKLAWFGPPQLSKEFFGISRFCDLYERMEELTPDQWQAKFRKSLAYREHIYPVVKKHKLAGRRRPRRLKPAPGVSVFGQWMTLTGRFVRLQLADRTTFAVTLAQPLVITLLICVVCRDLNVINFLLVISALWFGCSGAAQQIVKERPVFRRERMVNLRLDTYLMSKFVPLMSLTAFQAAVMLAVICTLEDVEGSLLSFFVAFVLASWNGVAIGLLISAVASNGDKAMSVVPLSLIPQIILAGVLVPLPEMNKPTQWASMLTAARWGNQACEATVFESRQIDADLLSQDNLRPIWNLFPKEDLDTDEGRLAFLKEKNGDRIDRSNIVAISISILAAFVAILLGVTCWRLKGQDTL